MLRPRRLAAALLLLVPLSASAAGTKLYWFVPDGLRADPRTLDLFGWAAEGKLPNVKKMMERGSWGYSIPAFPSHTPSNFATLMTGAYPERHGVADGPMRVEGHALDKPSVNGFASTAKKTPPVWKTLEDAGLRVTLLSIPGSTPPELDAGATVRGRWGNWGADFHALNFEAGPSSRAASGASRLFYLGPELTRAVATRPAEGWGDGFTTARPALEAQLLAYGATMHALVTGVGDGYDAVVLSADKKTAAARLTRAGEWTDWLPVTLQWRGQAIETRARLCLIRLGGDGSFKVRWLFDVLNRTIVQPPDAAASLGAAAGPMVDFPDNWPAQLNRLPEEREVLLAEARMALEWHRRAAGRLLSADAPDALIQDTYVPNQMLESRWWLKHVDPAAPAYAATSPEERAARRAELLSVYQGIDAVLGEALDKAGPETVIVLSSDHGILPIKKEVQFNNLLAREGLLVFKTDPASGETGVDWARSKAAFLKMIGVYVNPGGLAGPWTRGSGPEYEKLRGRVARLLEGVKDGGAPVVEKVLPWERAGELRLPTDRVPDLVLAMNPGYALTEDMSPGGPVLRDAVQSGYKQAVIADGRPSLWTPFIVMGPGVKKGFKLPEPVRNADQAPTLLTLLGVPVPDAAQGRVIEELLAPK
ncbi:MAG: alkaline phosphatase family protein [Elusimicrobiota bacterium]|nr:alkaline phosphatase family protein [Elusimicrobiota bacterium]